MSTQLKVVDKPQMPEGKQPEGRERRKWARAMVSVSARSCGGVGTLECFEEIVTCLDISREGIRVPSMRRGDNADQHLEVTRPFWDNPTAINTPRAAKVIRCSVIPNHGYEVAIQFLSNKPEESFVLRQRGSVRESGPCAGGGIGCARGPGGAGTPGERRLSGGHGGEAAPGAGNYPDRNPERHNRSRGSGGQGHFWPRSLRGD